MAFQTDKIICPLVKTPKVSLCDPSELRDLVSFLEKNERPCSDMQFERGCVSSDGRLDLCKQGIGVPGTEMLVNALRNSAVVKHILLGTDSLGDEGAKALASYINDSNTLETVYLGCNLIAEDGVNALSNALNIIHTSNHFG